MRSAGELRTREGSDVVGVGLVACVAGAAAMVVGAGFYPPVDAPWIATAATPNPQAPAIAPAAEIFKCPHANNLVIRLVVDAVALAPDMTPFATATANPAGAAAVAFSFKINPRPPGHSTTPRWRRKSSRSFM